MSQNSLRTEKLGRVQQIAVKTEGRVQNWIAKKVIKKGLHIKTFSTPENWFFIS